MTLERIAAAMEAIAIALKPAIPEIRAMLVNSQRPELDVEFPWDDVPRRLRSVRFIRGEEWDKIRMEWDVVRTNRTYGDLLEFGRRACIAQRNVSGKSMKHIDDLMGVAGLLAEWMSS